MSFKLSICIPTYNRAKFLPYLLDSILREVDINNPVEICISDNASSDNTKNLVEEYKRKYPHIMYFCWPENVGFDRNLLNAVSLAHGEYCWLMSSDDILEADAILVILNKLTKHKDLTCMVLNRTIFDANCDKQLYEHPVKRVGLNLDSDKLFVNAKEEIMCFFHYFGYVSIHVISKKLWDEVVNSYDLKPFYNSYIHMHVIGLMLQKNPSLLYVHHKCVKWRSGNDSFLQPGASGLLYRMKIAIVGYEAMAKYFLGYQSREYRKVLNTEIRIRILGYFFTAKLTNTKGFFWNALKLTFNYYWSFPLFWLYLLPFALLPRQLLLLLRYLYRVTLKPLRTKKMA